MLLTGSMSPLKLTEGKSDPNSCWDTLRVESIKKTRDSTEIPSPRDCTWSANVCVCVCGLRGGGEGVYNYEAVTVKYIHVHMYI